MNTHERASALSLARAYLTQELFADDDLSSLSHAQRLAFERDVTQLAEVLCDVSDAYWTQEEGLEPTIFETFARETVQGWRREGHPYAEPNPRRRVIRREAARLAMRLEDAAAWYLGHG